MAAAAPSSLASSVEKTNGAKLSRLLIDGGTTVLRTIFNLYHPPANLLADLHANYRTLNNLLRRRVLHRSQWDLLFPPSGATPDSNTFDITLLFLLLTNICGLSPPPSGWHTCPPPSDTSLEANLARIKLFRNELYGHVTTTGVDTPTFSALWLEISAVLVALGLNQAEIDRLKAERCGEEDYIDVLREWADSEEDIKSQLKDIRQVLQDTNSKIEGVSEQFQQLQQKYEDIQGERSKQRVDEILKNIAKIDSLKDMKRHTERYVKGTRTSIFAEVENWLDDRNSSYRVMVISGNPGMGKSVVSAIMCEKMLEAGRLAGCHFCRHDRARHRNPKVMLQSLASQLADFSPEYKKVFVEKMSGNLGVEINNMEVIELFELLFEEPLTTANDPGVTYLMVIDGIDESEHQGRNELLNVIADNFKKLPSWIRFLVTTRPETNITERLKCLHPLQLVPDHEDNLKDIHLCFKERLSCTLQSEYQEVILQSLVQKSEGVMLYAHYLVDFIKENVPLLTPELLDSTLPTGISSVYHSYFKRLETELRKELEVTEDQFMNFLSAVAAARGPLPLGFVAKLLLSGTSASAVQRKVNAAIVCVSALLPVQEGRIHFFHKSVKDWLLENSDYGQHHFSVDDNEGHRVLSKLCIDELDELKRKGVDGTHFTDTAKYALQHGVQHMLQLDEDARDCSLEDVAKRHCLDLELLFAKLCLSDTAASDDIVCIQKQAGAEALFEESQRALGALLYLLRKYLSTLTERPGAIFQTLLNEGEPDLSSEALTLLETRYSGIPYMEFAHKKDLKGLVQTKFQCFAKVVCFDVSPQLDYMVCECGDDTIQLWSLQTGKQLWKRRVMVTKDSLFRKSKPHRTDVLSFYRSVVFHPAEDLVLPGILSQAYTFDGELKPLFLSSKCRFSVCSVSADKAKMITDCPDNAKSVMMWSLTDGSEITAFVHNRDILSFAWSPNERVLAISASYGLISLVDVMDGFKTLAEITTIECGLIKFSPDCQFLLCFTYVMLQPYSNSFCLLVKMDDYSNCSLHLHRCNIYSFNPWESKSCSKTGFLLGDSFCLSITRGLFTLIRPALAFVLNEQSVLRVSYHGSVIHMLHRDELTKRKDGMSITAVREVLFSLDGDTLYLVTNKKPTPTTLMAWDISSEKFKANQSVDPGYGYFTGKSSCLVAVGKGVLWRRRTNILELWNVELSECVRCWSDIGDIERVVPISEERVACEARKSNELIILDTTSRDIVSTITYQGELVACNSKCQVITARIEGDELQMQCGKDVLWKISPPFNVLSFFRCNTFSPTGQYCVVGGEPKSDRRGDTAVYVLDAVSGRTLHMLCAHVDSMVFGPDCTFVSDEECVINIVDHSKGDGLQLFNVTSGDLLSEIAMEAEVLSLAALPQKRLIAVGLKAFKDWFKILKVKLPRDKDSKKNKRIKF